MRKCSLDLKHHIIEDTAHETVMTFVICVLSLHVSGHLAASLFLLQLFMKVWPVWCSLSDIYIFFFV